MQDELIHFERHTVWKLVPRPKDHPVIRGNWVLNKLDETSVIDRNKASLLVQSFNKEESTIMMRLLPP